MWISYRWVGDGDQHRQHSLLAQRSHQSAMEHGQCGYQKEAFSVCPASSAIWKHYTLEQLSDQRVMKLPMEGTDRFVQVWAKVSARMLQLTEYWTADLLCARGDTLSWSSSQAKIPPPLPWTCSPEGEILRKLRANAVLFPQRSSDRCNDCGPESIRMFGATSRQFPSSYFLQQTLGEWKVKGSWAASLILQRITECLVIDWSKIREWSRVLEYN